MGMAADPARRQPTLDAVAELAGVSRSVASRVLNNAPHVSRSKREAVERAVRQLDYVPNPSARALVTRQTRAAALVISGEEPSIFADPFFAQVIVGASAALEEADLHLMLCLAASDRGRERVAELLRCKGADGVMMMALREDDPLARTAEEADLPVVFGGRPVGSVPRWYVDVDNTGGAREGTEYLLSRGRTRVAALCGRLDTEAGRARYRGYRDAMLAAGLDPFPPREGTSPSPAAPRSWPRCWPNTLIWTGCSPPATTWGRGRCAPCVGRDGRSPRTSPWSVSTTWRWPGSPIRRSPPSTSPSRPSDGRWRACSSHSSTVRTPPR